MRLLAGFCYFALGALVYCLVAAIYITYLARLAQLPEPVPSYPQLNYGSADRPSE